MLRNILFRGFCSPDRAKKEATDMATALPRQGAIDIRYTNIAAANFNLSDLRSFLTISEVERADRYVFEPDRRRSIVARGLLRLQLGWYLGIDPKKVPLSSGAFGKPGVSAPIEFNVTHSHDYVAFAFATGSRVGIDVQKIDHDRDVIDLSKRCLTAVEFDQLSRLPQKERAAAFYLLWSRKEAFLKGTGFGLTRSMQDVEVSMCRGRNSVLRGVVWDPAEVRRWSVRHLDIDPSYASAVACEGHHDLNVDVLSPL
jgi:4'-phosphopantetheinyl transferase